MVSNSYMMTKKHFKRLAEELLKEKPVADANSGYVELNMWYDCCRAVSRACQEDNPLLFNREAFDKACGIIFDKYGRLVYCITTCKCGDPVKDGYVTCGHYLCA